jgi:ribosomal protein L15E
MYNEKFINIEQRGFLKELIIDRDSNLIHFLNEYEVTNDCTKLYENIIKLSKNHLRNE